ncbi:MATE efflux family protein [Xylona heveae TC161]|uniref:MATE efflux family protein n=1 Tax=Xylona heveae (strain CBS 132557 / TC161) TaxID=1328760 RepID=A0A165G4Y2_XYLHT|nr:MATE efflux family protein [Xylona heveae TC161]KZF21743.1 MATE efflux family protein [Xylona heveae TC161]
MANTEREPLVRSPQGANPVESHVASIWVQETKTLIITSSWLVLVSYLQYSFQFIGLLFAAQFKPLEMAAIGLGASIANITGYAIYQGLSTALDTLCTRAFGSGHQEEVGCHLQRMILLLWAVTMPIGLAWCYSSSILSLLVSRDVSELTCGYLRIVLLGAPGHAAFEAGKRFVHAQGIFRASFTVLLVGALANAFFHWVLVSKLKWGFFGVPVATAMTDNLLPFGLALYVAYVDGSECWPRLSKAVLTNWGPMLQLGLPGCAMVLAEFLSFEMLTLGAGKMSDLYLAAQSVLSGANSMAFQLPFSISLSTSVRTGYLIGQKDPKRARIQATAALVLSSIVGLINMTVLLAFRFQITRLLSPHKDVQLLAANSMPLCAVLQIAYALAECCNGLVRGLGLQKVASLLALACYYLVGLPLSFVMGFVARLGLSGLWSGSLIGTSLFAAISIIFVLVTNFDSVIRLALASHL